MAQKISKRKKVQYRIRKKVQGTSSKPRLAVFKSNKSIYCQLIDDLAGKTIASASSKEANGAGVDQAKAVGKMIAEKATGMNIEKVVFDRAGFVYHGRIKALADSAREAGLKF